MIKCKAHVLDAKWRSRDVMLEEKADFSSLLLSEKVLRGLAKARFQHPSPIQLEAIPAGRCGTDLVIQAKSGTGKTLVFTVIALEMLMDIKTLQVLIMAPTREIATQICDVIKTVGSSFTKLRCASFIGGLPLEEDKAKSLHCQIAVGTPGRIKQLIDIGYLRTNAVRLFVLDEADELLRATCTGDIDWIFQTLPEDKQVIAASATYPKELEAIINKYFRQPYVIRLNIDELSLLGTIHYACLVEECKMPVLAYKLKIEALKKVLCAVKFSQCIVYCNLVSRVEGLCYDIQKWGFSVTHISSAKDQLDRLKAIERLKQFKCKVLVSSDVTARGIDAENVDIIINFDCPMNTETYLHRVGRAGRYGSQGIAVTFLSENQLSYFEKIATAGSFKVYLLSDPVPSNLITKRPEVNNEAVFGGKDEKLSNPLKMFYGADEMVNSMGNNKPEGESAVVNYFQKRKFLDCHSDASKLNGTSNNNTNGIVVVADQDIQLLNENSDSLKFEDGMSNQREKNECHDSNIKCVSVNIKMKLQESQYQSNGTCDSELHESNCDTVKAFPEQAIDPFKFTQSESKISELFECQVSKPNDRERNAIENETVTDKYILFDERTVPASLTCNEPSDLNHTQPYCENEYAKQQLTNSWSKNYNEQVLEHKERTNNFNLKESVIEGPMSVLENQQSASDSKNFSDKQKGVQQHSLPNNKSVDGVCQKTENLNSKSLDEIKEFVINFVCKYENQELLNAETLSVKSNFEPDEECLQRFQNELASPEQIRRLVNPKDIKNRKQSMLKYYYELFKEYQDYFENNLQFDSNPLKEKIHHILKENEVADGYCEAFQVDAHGSKTQQVLNSDNVKNLFCDARSEKCSSEAINENDTVNAEVGQLLSGSSELESGGLPRIENFYKFAEALYCDPMEITELSTEESSSESSSGATEEDDIVNDAISNMPKGEVKQHFSTGNSEHESEGLPKIENFHKFTEAVNEDYIKTPQSASEKSSSEAINEDEIINANVLTMPEDEVKNLSFINNSESESESLPKIVDFYKFAEALNRHCTDVGQSASEDEASSGATNEDEIINADIQNLPKGLVEDLFATEHGLESLPTVDEFYKFAEAINRNNMEVIQLSPEKSSETDDENDILKVTPYMPKSESELSFVAEKSEHKSENLPIIEDIHEFDGTIHQDYMEFIQSCSETCSDYAQLKTNEKMLKYAFPKNAITASDHNVNHHENRKVPKEVFGSETDDDDVSFHKNYEKDFVQRNPSDKKPKHGIAKNYSKIQNYINHSVRRAPNDFELYKKNSESKRHRNHSMSQKSKHCCEIFKNCSKMSHHNANNSAGHDLYCGPSTYTPRRTDHPACFHNRIRNFKHLEHCHDYREFSQNNVFHSTCNCYRNSHFCRQTNLTCKNGRQSNLCYDFHRSLDARSKRLKPSEHHCHPVNIDASCQSQMCSEWYKLFINQWLCIKNSIISHK